MKKLGLQCLLLAAFVFAAFTQVTTGRLEGTVTDPQGAAVPGATVKVANTQTGQNFSIVTDDRGLWTLPSLATALYSVSVGHPGFKTATIENVMHWKATADVAEHMQKGRVFLAGDAAHVMPPYGGFGGNCGIHDAHNLAWKLAMVVKGHASEKLLSTYEPERMPAGKRTHAT